MASKKQEATSVIYPELVEALRKDTEGVQPWKVRAGGSNRGEAFTDFGTHTIQVPFGNEEAVRLVRAHELAHTRISPADPVALAEWAEFNGIPNRVLSNAEEWRVNTLVGKLGYDLDLLTDGTESTLGKRIAETGTLEAFNEMVAFGAGLVGTKAFNAYKRGVNSVNKEWGAVLGEMSKQIKKVTSRYDTARNIGDTELVRFDAESDTTLPRGFINYTGKVAQIIASFQRPVNQDDSKGSSGVEYETGFQAGQFAPLKVDTVHRPDKQVKGHLAKKRVYSNSGKAVRNASRLLTDPQKRIFSRKVRANGGIVVIDLSGSMSLSTDELDQLLDASPGALVVGYTHGKKVAHKPNFWVLADKGKRVSDLSKVGGNIGNGVDGPALEWAIAHRRGSEPIIWVCDGQVTDSQDKAFTLGAYLCAQMMIKHRIIQQPTVEGAIKVLANPSGARSEYVGRVSLFIPASPNYLADLTAKYRNGATD
jgi:hypothetical protein